MSPEHQPENGSLLKEQARVLAINLACMAYEGLIGAYFRLREGYYETSRKIDAWADAKTTELQVRIDELNENSRE